MKSIPMTITTKMVFAKNDMMLKNSTDAGVADDWNLMIEFKLSLKSPPDRKVFESKVRTIDTITVFVALLAMDISRLDYKMLF